MNGRLKLSEKFVKAFYKAFDKDLKQAAIKISGEQISEFGDDSQAAKAHKMMPKLDMLSNLTPNGKDAEDFPILALLRSITTLVENNTKLVENNTKLVEGNTKLVSAIEKLVEANEALVASFIESNKKILR